MNKVALMAVVEKAFLQVGIQPEDRDVRRFFWLKDASKRTMGNNVQILIFTRVSFGMISCPFLLAALYSSIIKTKRNSSKPRKCQTKCATTT